MTRIPARRLPMIAATVATAALLVSMTAEASQKGPYTLKSGVPAIVLSYASYDPEMCVFMALPTYRIVQAPAHGTIEIGKSANELTTGPCKGKSMKSSAISYRSNPGYHGTDRIIVDAETANYTDGSGHFGDRVTIDIIVK